MKYLKYFETEAEYTAYKNGSDYVLPNVSSIVETGEVAFSPKPQEPVNVVISYRNYEQLASVFEKVHATLLEYGVMENVPVDLYWYNVPKINFPTNLCGFESIAAETNAYGDVYGNDTIGRVWKQTYEFSSNDFWFDYDKDESIDYQNIEATYFEILDTNYAICKIVLQDGSAKYILRMLM